MAAARRSDGLGARRGAIELPLDISLLPSIGRAPCLRALTIGQCPPVMVSAGKGRTMQIVLLIIFFGAVCAMGLWASVSVRAIIDEIARRGGLPFPPGEP